MKLYLLHVRQLQFHAVRTVQRCGFVCLSLSYFDGVCAIKAVKSLNPEVRKKCAVNVVVAKDTPG